MSTFRTRRFTAVGIMAVLGMLTVATVAAFAMTEQINKAAGNAGTPWYAEASAPLDGSATTNHATAAAEKAASTNYAKSLSGAFHNAAAEVLPSVVTITNTPLMAAHRGQRKPQADEGSEDMPFGFRGMPFGDMFKDNPEFHQFFKRLPSGPETPEPRMGSTGSGVIVDPSGIILTNNHVVAGGGRIMVRLHDGREFKAFDIKTDPRSDLAILRIKGAGSLPAARLGNSNKVQVGDWVLALGQPFGLEGTVTAGIISAKSRGLGITDREDFLQTDAAINPGNSGGPLVTLDGEVIGINTAISTSSGGYQGVGFAIPIDLAKWVGGQLVNGGHVHRSYLGVVIQPVTQPLAEQFQVKVHEGVLVTEVRPDTPAAKAGLKAGDIIVKFAGQTVSGPRELQGIVEMQKIGSAEPLALLRDGKELTLSVTCREMPGDFTKGSVESEESGNESSHFDKLGLQVEDLTPQVAEQLGVKTEHGVAITEVRSGSPAAEAGLSSGMVITQVNRRSVKTVDDFRKALEARPLDQGVLLLVHSAEGSRFVVIRVES